MKALTVRFADHCQWRGPYVYLFGRQVARLILDPQPHRPHLIVSFGFGNFQNMGLPAWVARLAWITHVTLNIPLPFIPYPWAARCPRLMPFYRLSSRFWHAQDGRFRT